MIFKKLIIAIGICFCLSSISYAEDIVLKQSHPTNYKIKKGDTLWDIASRFLRDPWRWPDIWYVNPQIRNPHLIYPGDEVVLTFKDGKPRLELRRSSSDADLRVVKLGPEVRKEQLTRPIPTIPINAIQQFLSSPKVMSRSELDGLPHIASSYDARLIAGTGDKAYVRNLIPGEATRYTIVRPGMEYRDSPREGKKALGHEALHVGEAVVKQYGDPATIEITDAKREVLIGDRLIPATAQRLDYSFLPHAPEKQVRGQIIAVVDGVSRIGQYQVVVINRGTANGLEKGHVLAVYQSGIQVRDRINSSLFGGEKITLPDEKTGHLMLFRTFEKVSYGLIMQATRDMRLYDMVVNP
ncbi:MAG: LysM peptidoglycan-binding domain-containing protein [Gammaproteobacteria bacterium]|nr:LysM peptidoglycan-binding domain-containing protein [Gammaproteobacteria bacterium]